jgi:hypothetical protein
MCIKLISIDYNELLLKEWMKFEEFNVCKSVQSHTFQTNQPTKCYSLSSLLLDVYEQLNMFRASSRPLSAAQHLQ